jgi:hypothetical protein
MGVKKIQLADLLAGTMIRRNTSNKSEGKKGKGKEYLYLCLLALTFAFLS